MDRTVNMLVIDDSPFIHKAVKRAVEPAGYKVIDWAQNGKSGLEKVTMHMPDIVTLDITMPVMDGIETARELVKMNYQDRVILMSAMSDQDLIDQAKEIGIKHFLPKPFKSHNLLDTVRIIMEKGE